MRRRFLPLFVLLSITSSAAVAADDVEAAYQYAMARLLAGEGEQEEAEQAFLLAIQADPEAPYLRVELATFLLQWQRVDRAAEQAAEARRLAPSDPDALRTFGLVKFEQARRDRNQVSLDQAIDAFEGLRRLEPADLQGMLTLGQIYQLRGRLDDAVSVYEDLLRHHADNDRLKRLLIDTLGRAGESTRARQLLEELVRLDRESFDSRLSLAEVESEKGNHGAAIEILEGAGGNDLAEPQLVLALASEYIQRSQLPGLTPEQRASDLARAGELIDSLLEGERRVDALRVQAQIALARNDVEGAVSVLEQARAAAPGDPRPWLDLAGVLEAHERLDEASAVLAELALASAENPRLQREVQLRRLRLEALSENWDEVLALSKPLLEDAVDEEEVFILGVRVQALMALDRDREALSLLQDAIKKSGATPINLLRQAEILVAAGRPKEAVKVLGATELEQSDAVDVIFARIRLLFEAEREDLALAAVERLVAQDPQRGPMRVGQMLSALEQNTLAVGYFERALAIVMAQASGEEARSSGDEGEGPERADVHFFLGAAYERIGRHQDAAAQFQSVLELRADDSDALNYLGYMWAEQGVHLEQALQLIERAVELQPDNGSYVDSLGWAQYRLGQHSEARASLERAAQLTPNNATIQEHLGDVYFALGERERARQAYELAVSLEDRENLERVKSKLMALGTDDDR